MLYQEYHQSSIFSLISIKSTKHEELYIDSGVQYRYKSNISSFLSILISFLTEN